MPSNSYKSGKNWPKITIKRSKIAMQHLKYAPIGSPGSMLPQMSIPNTCYLPKNMLEKTKKVKNGQKQPKKVILLVKFPPVENVFYAFSLVHLLGPSEIVVLHPRTLIRDSNRGLSAIVAKQSKMIIYSPKSRKMGIFVH